MGFASINNFHTAEQFSNHLSLGSLNWKAFPTCIKNKHIPFFLNCDAPAVNVKSECNAEVPMIFSL